MYHAFRQGFNFDRKAFLIGAVVCFRLHYFRTGLLQVFSCTTKQWQKQSPKTWATYFYSTLPDVPYCYNLTCYRGSPPYDVYNSTKKHIFQCTFYYRKSVLKKSHYRNYNIAVSELCITKFSFIFQFLVSLELLILGYKFFCSSQYNYLCQYFNNLMLHCERP